MQRYIRLLQIILLIAYPIVTHIAVYLHRPVIALISLGLLLMSYLLPFLRSNWVITSASIIFVLTIIILSIFHQSFALLYLPPIVISACMLWIFARTLRAKHEPLITTFARIIYHENSPEVQRYTRKVTQVWSIFFLALLLETILLSLFFDAKTWSLFCNILNYVFVAVLFLIEGIYRQFRFHLPNPFIPLFQYFAKNGIRVNTPHSPAQYPLIGHHHLQALFAVNEGKMITCQDFLADVFYLDEHLPEAQYIINLCENRYYFAVLFACILLRKQVCVMPNNPSALTLQQLQTEFSSSIVIDDQYLVNILGVTHSNNKIIHGIPLINSHQLAAVLYTSGSTGQPIPWKKYWGELVEHSHNTAKALELEKNQPIHIVATVAAQHMYGFEHSIMLPMQMGYAFNSSKPFFLDDIKNALLVENHETVLFSTPLHLKLCATSDTELPPIKLIISATAKLSNELAITTEKAFHTPLKEIYGCTEAGCIATRRTAITEQWELINGYTLEKIQEKFYLISPDVDEKILLADQLEIIDQKHFLLLGRLSDNINIAGKRMSLTDLNIKLNSIQGVEDGVFYYPTPANEDTRLIALVVAPTVSEKYIKTQLRQMIDPIFLPRPLIKVDKLPRNQIGKINGEALKLLINEHLNE